MGKLNLVPAIKEIEQQIRDMEYKHKQTIQPYLDSLSALREINQVCENCNGDGMVLRPRACAEDDAPDPSRLEDYIVCSVCNGSGRSQKDGLCFNSTY